VFTIDGGKLGAIETVMDPVHLAELEVTID
jgi:hypothetical protein